MWVKWIFWKYLQEKMLSQLGGVWWCVGLSFQWHRNVSDLINSNRCRVEVCWFMLKYLIASLIYLYSYIIASLHCLHPCWSDLMQPKIMPTGFFFVSCGGWRKYIVVGKDVKIVLQTWPVQNVQSHIEDLTPG